MKSTLKFASAMLLMASSAAFAAPQTAAQPAQPAHAKAAAVAPAKADVKAEQRQIRSDEKTALAACKTMKGAQKSSCKKQAVAKAQGARAHLKASRHA